MHGIGLKSGVNNCRWNIKGKCTNEKITKDELPFGFSRDWDSKQNCTFTILGVHLCYEYKPETLFLGHTKLDSRRNGRSEMPLYIIKWNSGYGDEFEEIEAATEKEATIYAHKQWREEVESNASYSTVGISTDELKEECGI